MINMNRKDFRPEREGYINNKPYAKSTNVLANKRFKNRSDAIAYAQRSNLGKHGTQLIEHYDSIKQPDGSYKKGKKVKYYTLNAV